MDQIVISAFYKFVSLDDYEAMQEPLGNYCRAWKVQGTILLAAEGINGTVAGSREGIDALNAYMRSDERLADLETKESFADFSPFNRMKVRLKREIVTLRQPVDPTERVGTYVVPQNWNELIRDPEVLLIDMRNDFEVQIGSFEGALNPKTRSFSQIAEYVENNLDPTQHKKVAMFCTGGIRCEKASSYFLQKGFDEVFHLKGGILKYLEEIPEEESTWHGECFVFDNRVTVNHDLQPGTYRLCHACWHPLTAEDIDSDLYEEDISCPYCHAQLNDKRLESLRERRRQVALAKERGEKHIGR